MSPGLPDPVRSGVVATLAGANAPGTRITSVTPVGGGCINPGAQLRTEAGERYFVKWSDGSAPAGFFAEEVRSLRAIEQARAVRVPAVVGHDRQWLLLEWLEPGNPGAESWEALGRQLAILHQTSADAFGWHADNWIGTLPQANDWTEDWPGFWIEQRLLPQWHAARRQGFFSSTEERLLDRIAAARDALLGAGNDDGPSLLHGDLWSGNVHMMAGGAPALIDPSGYLGHREVDLAMARLFGGFGSGFFAAYDEAWPLEPGADSDRRILYQLYYVLVHVNLFGAGYIGQARSILQSFG